MGYEETTNVYFEPMEIMETAIFKRSQRLKQKYKIIMPSYLMCLI